MTKLNFLKLAMRLVYFYFLGILTIGCAVLSDPKKPSPNEDNPNKIITEKPTISDVVVSEITRTSAVIASIIKSDGNNTITLRGVVYWTTPNDSVTVIDSSTNYTQFSCTLDTLTPQKQYFVKSFARNARGISYSDEITFTTSPFTAPIITIDSTVSTTVEFETSIKCIITDTGGKEISEKGICWSTTPDPNISDSRQGYNSNSNEFEITITNLQPNTTYYLRGYARNDIDISYTETRVIVVDIDGNIYNTVRIGNQLWTVENLKTTRLNDGTSIKHVTENLEWAPPLVVVTDPDNYVPYKPYPMYCYYDNNSEYKTLFGALYNWYAVGTELLAPKGWRVPSKADVVTLLEFLGPPPSVRIDTIGERKIAVKSYFSPTGSRLSMKDFNPFWNGTNETGFSAIPGGLRWGRLGGGLFKYLGKPNEQTRIETFWSCFWTSTDIYSDDVYDYGSNFFFIYSTDIPTSTDKRGATNLIFDSKHEGFSVRCIMDL